MLVLIATDEPHGTVLRGAVAGARPVVDGELVVPALVECTPAGDELFEQAWFGLASFGCTATAMVAERPAVTEVALRRRIHDWLDHVGTIDRIVQAWERGDAEIDGVACDDPVVAVSSLVDAHVAELGAICATTPVGTVLTRCGARVEPHRPDVAA